MLDTYARSFYKPGDRFAHFAHMSRVNPTHSQKLIREVYGRKRHRQAPERSVKVIGII